MDEKSLLQWTRLKANCLGAGELQARLLAMDASGFAGRQLARHQGRVRRAGGDARRLERTQAACWAVVCEEPDEVGAQLQAAVAGQMERFFKAWGWRAQGGGYRVRLGEWLRANSGEVLAALPSLEHKWPSYCARVRAVLRVRG